MMLTRLCNTPKASLTDDVGDLAGFNANHNLTSSFSAMTYVTDHTSAGVNPGPLSTAGALVGGERLENGGYFDAATVVTQDGDDTLSLYEVSLGLAVADASGNIQVFVDDLANIGSGNRTWYDGVGVEPVPEPATSLLALLSGVFLLRRRRS